ncbi:right-handed parallel beta-helix repeat-containing protein [Halobacterium yunchengense]|uniref:right-handed parallel beta-helix repeat-containing protein n=1 Tax=Halobacterium yunchengense TaxID=3108497 RepID=UPI00300A2D00
MPNDLSMLRREVLELGGSMAAFSGCLSSKNSTSEATSTSVEESANVGDVDGFDGSVVKTDHLVTDSRSADVVVWKDDDGTVYADGEDEVLASGDEFSAVVQAAVDAGASKIAVKDGHYVATDPVDLNSDTIVAGMGTGTTVEVAGTAAFWLEGEKTASSRLTADATTDDSTVSVADASPFAADELVLVTTDRRTDYRDQPYGEIRRITAVDESNGEIELTSGGLFDTYRTDNDAEAVAIDPVSNVTVRDMELVGADQQAYRYGVHAKYSERVLVDDVYIHGVSHSGVRYASTVYSAVENCQIHDVAYEAGGVGYGVALSDAVRNVRVRNNVLHHARNHCTAVGGSGEDGLPRLLTFQSNEYYENDADVHFGGVVQFRDNRFVNGKGGIISGANTTYVSDCEFRNLEEAAIRNRGDPDELVVVDSQFTDIDEMALNLYSNPSRMSKVTVAANDFTDVDGNVVRFRVADGGTCEFFGVTENVVNGCGSSAFNLDEIGDSRIGQTNFVGNHFEDVADFAISTSGISGPARLIGNTFADVDGSYVVIAGGSNVLFSNNDLDNYANRGLLVRDPGLVAGNAFNRGDDNAVLVYEAEDVLVTHNKFERTSRDDLYEVGATDCKFVQNDVNTEVDVSSDENVVRNNYGYRTEDTGTYTASGDGGRTFDIPHDLAEDAVVANVWAESAAAAGSFYVSGKDSDAITVTYESAPPSGSDNLTWGYEANTHTN